jgi:hypothetical protein
MTDRRYPPLSTDLQAQLAAFAPSRAGGLDYWPSRVVLVDRTEQDRVVIAAAPPYIKWWGVWPEDDPGKRALPLEQVAVVRESDKRLPAVLADKLYAEGESGMGYYVFTVVLRDDRRLPFVTGGVVDFPALPAGIVTDDIVDVLPHIGGEHFQARAPATGESAADYTWCLFGP